MNIQQLEYFVMMAETGQITEAAQRLYITQPPLSRSLQRLEKELGTALFIRSKQGLELTGAGRVLYDKSKWLLKYYKEMLTAIQEADRGVQGTVRVGTGYPTIPLLAERISAMRAQYPAIEFNIVQEDPDELLDLLRRDRVDLVLSPRLVDDDAFDAITLEPDPLVLVVNPRLYPAPEEQAVPIERLEGVPMCMLRSGDFYGYNEILINECQKHGFTPRIFCQCNSASTALILVAQGLGLSYQPKMVVDTMANPNLYGKPIANFESAMRPVILRSREVYMSGATRLFLAQFQPPEILSSDELREVLDAASGDSGRG